MTLVGSRSKLSLSSAFPSRVMNTVQKKSTMYITHHIWPLTNWSSHMITDQLIITYDQRPIDHHSSLTSVTRDRWLIAPRWNGNWQNSTFWIVSSTPIKSLFSNYYCAPAAWNRALKSKNAKNSFKATSLRLTILLLHHLQNLTNSLKVFRFGSKNCQNCNKFWSTGVFVNTCTALNCLSITYFYDFDQ